MAFTEDSLKAKLSSLNETQDSISTVGQWILFHRRHAERIAAVWLQRMKESPPNKKLVLIYLANEITQTSKMRKKEEFLRAYEPIIAEATTVAYKGSPHEIQNKIRRVVEVWRQRQIFNQAAQQSIEKAMNDVDSSKSLGRKPALGGSLFSSSSVPAELKPVAPLATSVEKADLTTKPTVATANQEYEKVTNSNYTIPSAPVHAAGLSTLVKKLAVAEGAVAESIKARHALIAGLETLLATNKAKLDADTAQAADLKTRKDAIESRKRQVEDAILQGLSAIETNRISAAPLPVASTPPADQHRPDVEQFTPPPMESFTPVGSPHGFDPVPDIGDDVLPEPVAHPVVPETAPAPGNASSLPDFATTLGAPNVAQDLLRSLQHARPGFDGAGYGQHAYEAGVKKRKMSNQVEDEYAAFAGDGDMEGIDNSLGNLI
ncbi:RNA polymerase II-binding domain-containing protein [Boeremia exigua]|uniref:RNA polymerase II-binding domain-containing protein n=1 Tax=Boeremia exigua TaxID=749465 RepID=UPI001E8D9D67|nr:RNA polymerase II-binding domain-containing protein [Boeremia exigua]KAH6644097.1 RNA polymerase II-binding domain-containing protein [Boeremia exigua]